MTNKMSKGPAHPSGAFLLQACKINRQAPPCADVWGPIGPISPIGPVRPIGSIMAITRTRPNTVLVAAILTLVYSAYAILGAVCAGSLFTIVAMGAMPKLPAPAVPGQKKQHDIFELWHRMVKEAPSSAGVEIGASAVGLCLGVAAIIAAINLLRMTPRARIMGIAVAVGNILLMLANTGFQFVVVIPIHNQIVDEQVENLGNPAGGGLGGFLKGPVWVTLAFSAFFNVAIWLTVILLLSSKAARNAFAAQPAAESPAEKPRQIGRAPV